MVPIENISAIFPQGYADNTDFGSWLAMLKKLALSTNPGVFVETLQKEIAKNAAITVEESPKFYKTSVQNPTINSNKLEISYNYRYFTTKNFNEAYSLN